MINLAFKMVRNYKEDVQKSIAYNNYDVVHRITTVEVAELIFGKLSDQQKKVAITNCDYYVLRKAIKYKHVDLLNFYLQNVYGKDKELAMERCIEL